MIIETRARNEGTAPRRPSTSRERPRPSDFLVVGIGASAGGLNSLSHLFEALPADTGMGFAPSLGRYLEVRRRYPDAEMMMCIGNLTELTDADSAGINVLLLGLLLLGRSEALEHAVLEDSHLLLCVL